MMDATKFLGPKFNLNLNILLIKHHQNSLRSLCMMFNSSKYSNSRWILALTKISSCPNINSNVVSDSIGLILNIISQYPEAIITIRHQSFLHTQGMKTIIILGLLQVCLYQTLAIFSPADWALEIKHNDPEADNDFINATEIVNLDLLPFLRAVISSEEIQWEVMRNWLMDKGILKLTQLSLLRPKSNAENLVSFPSLWEPP